MYDHEYEWDILGFLRMLKYVWQRDKDILADLVRDYRCVEIDTEDIFELSVMLLVEYICALKLSTTERMLINICILVLDIVA